VDRGDSRGYRLRFSGILNEHRNGRPAFTEALCCDGNADFDIEGAILASDDLVGRAAEGMGLYHALHTGRPGSVFTAWRTRSAGGRPLIAFCVPWASGDNHSSEVYLELL
jgi:hypothetical protein